MRAVVRATQAGTVGSLEKERPDLELADLSQDVEAIKEYFGNRPAVRPFDGFLVKIEDGEYTDVYGYHGNIAYTNKTVYKITRTFSPDRKYSMGKKRGTSRRSHVPTGIGGVR